MTHPPFVCYIRYIDSWNADGTAWARFSPCETKRYRLARHLGASRLVVPDGYVVSHLGTSPRRVAFLMLNPSTATAFADDPTIRRGIAFARSWGADIYEAGNIHPLRATDPQVLYKVSKMSKMDISNGLADPENDRQILAMARSAWKVIAAWGTHGALERRGDQVRQMMADAGVTLYHLGLNKDGSPKHPLYIRGGTEPQEWTTS